jgi:hypothetical protein
MHATDLVGINGVTPVLLVYTCQQGVHPRGHLLPFDSHQWSHYHINQFISVITKMLPCLSLCDSLTPPASACESPPIGKGTRFCVGEDGQFVMVNIDFLLMLRLTVRRILTPHILSWNDVYREG